MGGRDGNSPVEGKLFVRSGKNHAATYVSWEDSLEFCRKLSEKEGTQYRMPTEAEWEYACRAGNDLPEETLIELNNLLNEDEVHARLVGEGEPNRWGLHNMRGNVFEWCRCKLAWG